MIRVVSLLLLLLLPVLLSDVAQARRGNPNLNSFASMQFYIVDSDDDLQTKPTYAFIDTTFGSWTRITGFSNSDNGYARVFSAAPISFTMFDRITTLPPAYVHVNGMMTFDSVRPESVFDSLFNHLTAAANGPLQQNAFTMVCPLWTDLELRTTGDTSKLFYRMTSDSCIMSFYNMGLKGSNGRIRATFQVVFATADSSITVHYRSFDGTYDGEPAAAIFQRLASIGVQDTLGRFATNYLDRNTYFATSRAANPSLYELNLHNSLAVKFRRVTTNFFTIKYISTPAAEGYEMPSGPWQPGVRIMNHTDTEQVIHITNEIFNTATGAKVYSRLDSFHIEAFEELTHLTFHANLNCGSFRMTSTIQSPALGADPWTHDNGFVRHFVRLAELSIPYLEDFKQLGTCNYNIRGAFHSTRAEEVMRDPAAPFLTGAVVLDRAKPNGVPYTGTAVGDTLTTSFFNLVGKSGVWLAFSYQRGLSTDSTFAGIRSRKLLGPEMLRTNGSTLVEGDTLLVEALLSSGSTFNPSAASWGTIARLHGGIDLETKKFRVQVPSTYLHNHSRFRIRVAAMNNGPKLGFPFDDHDPFVIDGLQIASPTTALRTDLEPIGLELGAKHYTHIPRDVKLITPIVKIASNGLEATQAVYSVRLVLRDALGREVYHRGQSLVAPAPRSDVTLAMPSFPIEGSQGGVFNAKVIIEQVSTDYYRGNDTNTFFRRLAIDDVYALDDGIPDTVGTIRAAHHSWFFYTFKPLSTDSLRGMEFFHITPSGQSSWVVTFRDSANNQRYIRSLSYDALERGFHRAYFSSPVPLSKDSSYIIQFNLTQGNSVGGDASYGLVIQDNISPLDAHFWHLHPTLLNNFSDNISGNYGNATSPKNGLAGGPILPMLRFVYRGSSTYLPVELLSLRANRSAAGNVLIDFATASESEVSNFTIERSSGAERWQHVASIQAANAKNGASYSHLDANAPREEVYYRLISHDLDGSSQILGTVTVGGLAGAANALRVKPNPASSYIQLLLPSVAPNMRGAIYDEAGRLVQTFMLDGTSQRVDLVGLSQGMYIVEVIIGSERHRAKVWVTE